MTIRSQSFARAAILVSRAFSLPLRAQGFAVADRIEVRDGDAWRRGVVSEDNGPSASTMKVRLDPTGNVTVIARAKVRLAPRPATINVGDRLEWNGGSVTSFEYVPATVKTIGTGSMQGYYLMAWDKYPNSPSYTKRENLWVLPTVGVTTASSVGTTPLPGLYRCFAYGRAGAAPIFLNTLTLAEGGEYTAFGKRGHYTFDATSSTITWIDGWAKDNAFGGAVESNALFRLRSNTVCSHS